MEASSETIGLLITFILSVVIACSIIFLNKILGPKHKQNPAKSQPFECGETPFESPGAKHFSIKFYLVAMLFILFDVEIVWLFPWAVVLRTIRWTGLLEMFAFLAVLALGFIYAWRKGALDWER